MSRLDYHPTYMASVRDHKLPHYQTAFNSNTGARHPLDYKYACGFDPQGKTLKECAAHWRECKSSGCQSKARNWIDLKYDLLESFEALKGIRH